MEDAAIIALYWARDQRAISATDEKYGTPCRALATRLLDSREDGEECVNDTWHRAWNTMPPQRPVSLRAYLLKIVRNLSIDRWRGRQARKRGGGTGGTGCGAGGLPVRRTQRRDGDGKPGGDGLH